MAGLKKPNRKKENNSPNLALVISLVFFVLVSIGLGVWGYYGYAGQEKYLADAKTNKNLADSAKKGEDYYRLLTFNYRLALGVGETLTADERTEYDGLMKEYKEGTRFKDPSFEKNAPIVTKIMAEAQKQLGPKDNGNDYAKTYKSEVERLATEVQATKATLTAKEEKLDAAEKQFAALQAAQDKFFKQAGAKIDAGNTAALKESQKVTAEMSETIKNNRELNETIAALTREKTEIKEKYERQVKLLENEVAKGKVDKVEIVSSTRNANDVHALLLDVSRGKPLWDNPLGKITHVDLAKREASINLGSSDSIKPEATFTVFGAGPYGRAEKALKGTLEVIRITGPHAALARITSLYDATGLEINVNDSAKFRASRESETALNDGDLLFNMFWHSRVALVGAVSLTNTTSDNPVAQMRQLDDFRYHLEHMGIAVDAYLDLTDGQMKGAITSKTRYLIRGEDARLDPPGKVKEGEPDPKAERTKALQDANAAMRKEAIEKGLLLISDENFLNVTGYRRPRSSGQTATAFRPSLPTAGVARPAMFAAPVRNEEKAAPMDEEKKAAEMK